MPFDTVSRDSFKELLNLANPNIVLPTKQTITNLLAHQEIEIRKNLKNLLNKQDFVCTTVDAWSCRAQHYLGMSVHYIDKYSLERKSYILAFRRLTKKQEYKYLAQNIYAIHKAYGLLGKVTHTVTDGGTNMCKSFRVFTSSIIPNESLPNTETESDSDDESEEHVVDIDSIVNSLEEFNINVMPDDLEALELDLDEVASVNVSQELEDAFSGALLSLPEHMRCFSHLLNLVDGDFNKLILKTSLANHYKQAFAKLNRFFLLYSQIGNGKRYM